MLNIEEIKAREQAATPGPWKWKKDVLTAPVPGYVVIKPFLEDSPEKVTICILPNDMKFIAAARTDIPALIEQHEQDQQQIATLKKALELACADAADEQCPHEFDLYTCKKCDGCSHDCEDRTDAARDAQC